MNSAGFCDEHSWVYVGLDLEEVPADLQGVEEQHMTIERVALADVPAMIADRRLLDAKSIIGLTLAAQHAAAQDIAAPTASRRRWVSRRRRRRPCRRCPSTWRST